MPPSDLDSDRDSLERRLAADEHWPTKSPWNEPTVFETCVAALEAAVQVV